MSWHNETQATTARHSPEHNLPELRLPPRLGAVKGWGNRSRAGDWLIFRPVSRGDQQSPCGRKMCLSPWPKGTVPFSRRKRPFPSGTPTAPRKLGQSPVNSYGSLLGYQGVGVESRLSLRESGAAFAERKATMAACERLRSTDLTWAFLPGRRQSGSRRRGA